MPHEYLLETRPLDIQSPYSPFMLYDDMSPPLKWITSPLDDDRRLEITHRDPLTGKHALLLASRTTGAAADDEIVAARHAPLTFIGPTRAETALKLISDAATFKYIDFWIRYGKPAGDFYSSIRADYQNDKFQYRDHTNTLQDIPNGSFSNPFSWWTDVALLVNTKTDKYISLIVCDTTFDLSTYSTFQLTSVEAHQIQIWIVLTTLTTSPIIGLLDTLLIKQEP